MFKVGQSLGDYAILQELGKGGFGQVYKVEHTITGRREAMKVLAAGNANAAEQSERFLREIRLQASLSHPNIAVVHTAFWINDDLALVCELLEGESLEQRLERQPPSQRQALEIMAQVLDALSYAHARGIIHRDVSPANIFLTAAGTVKIIDFGLAKAATDLRLTREGSPVGAAHYMSPEQIRGAQDIDVRTDVYSCGVVLYELLAGKKPFEGDSSFDIMKAHAEEPPPPPTAVSSQVSSVLSAIVLRALEKKPEARFQSADAFHQAIREVKPAHEADPARATPAGASLRRPLSRPVLIALCAMLTILIGALVAAVGTRRGNAQSPGSQVVAVPPPPAIVTPSPAVAPANLLPAAVPAAAPKVANVPKIAAPKVAKTTRIRKPPSHLVAAEKSPVSTALVESAEQQNPSTPTSTGTTSAPEAKPRNPVVKLGGVLKRMNPFQQSSSTSSSSTSSSPTPSSSTPRKDDPKN